MSGEYPQLHRQSAVLVAAPAAYWYELAGQLKVLLVVVPLVVEATATHEVNECPAGTTLIPL